MVPPERLVHKEPLVHKALPVLMERMEPQEPPEISVRQVHKEPLVLLEIME